ncbi:MAG: hypothetical protein K0R36_890 [Chryseobacterium sp.]|jgi:hypothetical protein|nr:hypothetical protein [Chryseobacterium sp.]
MLKIIHNKNKHKQLLTKTLITITIYLIHKKTNSGTTNKRRLKAV